MIVINADKVILTGNKLDDKIYYHHTGYVGHMKETPYRKLMAEKPEFVVKKAIVGMLPKAPWAARWLRSSAYTPGRSMSTQRKSPKCSNSLNR